MKERELIRKYKTPFYLYDEVILAERTDCMRKALPGIGLCFALKAAPILAGCLAGKVDRLEVCSPGEYEICIRNGVSPDKLLVSGVNKSYESINRILELGHGEGWYTIESPEHFEILDRCAREADIVLNCYIRLSSGNQFGVDKDTLEELAFKVNESENLNLTGIHFFSGTQKTLKRIEGELSELAEYGKSLRQKLKTEIGLEFGPGLGVNYFGAGEASGYEAEKTDAEKQLANLAEIVDRTGVNSVYRDVTFEYGRFIAAASGRYFTGVADIKKTYDVNYAILEGGIHQLTYYGSMAGMKIPYIMAVSAEEKSQSTAAGEKADGIAAENKADGTETKEYVLAGSLCSVNDILVRKAVLPELKKGDTLIFDLAGAYALTEGIGLFLSRDLPAVLIRDLNGEVRLVRDHMETNSINDGTGV